MTPAQFGRIEALFHEALERPHAERAQFLRERESDPELVAAVERLLACDQDPGQDPVAERLTEVARDLPLRTIGPYRLLRELGSGGMGTVFLAERDVAGRVQQVAVKLLHGVPTATSKRRMDRERAMLAGLNHPNIARHIDGGESEEGQPYLVMDYVDSQPLPEYLAAAQPSLPQRLRLYLSLCDAVQHAHQRLVLHRDIKPSNVVVRADGSPVLLDFGVGALLDEGDNPTHPPTRAFTPGYSAPEQYRGQVETTASDVFSLGALLFDLLTGQRLSSLYRDTGAVPAPSASVADPALRRLLRGDLDRIVRKATAADPEQRYRTVAALMDDVSRYLQGRPISAAPDRIWYRIGKFVRRNRVAVAASALLVVSGSLGVWQLNNERRRALDAERVAATEAANAKASRDFLASVLAETSPEAVRGQPIAIATLLTKAAERLREDRSQDPQARLVAWLTIAEVYADINDPQPGLAAIDAAQALLARTAQPDPELSARAWHVRGLLLLQLERVPQARAALERAIALRRQRAGAPLALARLYSDYATAVLHAADFAAAQGYQQRALERLNASGLDDPALRMEIELGLARSLYYQNDIDAAARHLGMAEAIDRERPAHDGLAAYQLRRIAMMVRYSQHRYPEALANAEQALRLAYRVYGENSRLTADMELYTALMLDDIGRSRTAIDHYRRAQAIARALKLDDAVLARDDVRMAMAYANLADHARAMALTSAALNRMPATAAYAEWRTKAYYTRALSLSAAGAYLRAGEDFARALEIARGNPDDVFVGPAFVRLRQAQGLVLARRFDEAAAALAEAEPTVIRYRDIDPKSIIALRTLQAQVAAARGEAGAAAQRIGEALQLGQRHYLAGTAPIATIELAAARIALDANEPARARELLAQAEAPLRQQLHARAPALAEASRLDRDLRRAAPADNGAAPASRGGR